MSPKNTAETLTIKHRNKETIVQNKITEDIPYKCSCLQKCVIIENIFCKKYFVDSRELTVHGTAIDHCIFDILTWTEHPKVSLINDDTQRRGGGG